MDNCRVVLADDHAILTQGTASILSDDDEIEIVGTAANGEELHLKVNELQPDVIIADISMPGTSIFDISEEIKQKGLPTQTIIFTMHDSPAYVYKALNSHIAGYLTKNAESDELIAAIKQIWKGKEYYSHSIRQIIIKGYKNRNLQHIDNQDPISHLSPREKEVLDYLTKGLNSKQIGKKLFLSDRTIANHRANMLQKCNVHNTVELVRLYLEGANKW
ncbi:two-component system response regulator DegU [Catalinimonas alkaloidigena]|uniref:response regulator transcription factor n=1 Tax=Catalinimonas alkaloidigena TaxID=1075417 RepID=UPI00240772D3|nr:response regulator transcription factor [Catalinimonas alkaloidigena]MDF9797083.1 two-component system response regulator DegU [Catalinimonas alkaloidigena]